MMRNKFVLMWLFFVVSVWLLNACGTSPTPTSAPVMPTPFNSPPPLVTTTPYATVMLPPTRAANTVTFAVYGDAAEKIAYQKLVDVFQEKNPDVRVELTLIPNQFAYRERITGDFAVGSPPDVVLLNNRRYGFFGLRRMLEPLGPYLETSDLVKESEFYPETLAPFRIQGQLMCIPQSASNLVVYYNKELFAQANLPLPRADWTWDEFLATAQALTRDTNGDGNVDQYGLGTEGDLLRLAPFIWQNNGKIFDNDARPTTFVFDAAAQQALQWVVDLQVKHHVVPDPDAEILESFETRFMNGTIAMFINQRRGVGMYRDMAKFDWDVAPLPRNKAAAGILQAEAYCLPLASDNKAGAWRLIEFASSVEGQTILAASGRIVPTLRAVGESAAYLQPDQKPASARIFLDTLPQAHSFPILINWSQIEEVAGEQIERAFHGYETVEAVIPKAILRTEPLFKR